MIDISAWAGPQWVSATYIVMSLAMKVIAAPVRAGKTTTMPRAAFIGEEIAIYTRGGVYFLILLWGGFWS